MVCELHLNKAVFKNYQTSRITSNWYRILFVWNQLRAPSKLDGKTGAETEQTHGAPAWLTPTARHSAASPRPSGDPSSHQLHSRPADTLSVSMNQFGFYRNQV